MPAPEPPETSSEDCWFGGEKLPAPRVGSFQLHWNGTTLEQQPYPNQGDPVEDMRALESSIFASVTYNKQDLHNEGQNTRPPVLHFAEAGTEMQPLQEELPLYASSGESAEALEYLHLGSAEGALWAATSKQSDSSEGEVTVIRRFGGEWTQVIGPASKQLPDLLESPQEEEELLGGPARDAEVRAIAPEAGSEDAWLALSQRSTEREATVAAVLVHISAQGEVLGVQTLPSPTERELPSNATGAAQRLVCPALEDCWMANVNGWLYHLAREGERTLPTSELPGFPEGRIVGESERPPDEGVPQEVLDAPPPDTSGLREEAPDYGGTFAETKAPTIESKLKASLLTDVHSRLVHGTTLELRFHLAVKARVRLLAKRRKKVVARTPMRTFAAGNRKLLLRLNPHGWPTKLELQTHALAPLPTTTVKEAVGGPEHSGNGSKTESTGLTVLPRVPTFFAELGALP